VFQAGLATVTAFQVRPARAAGLFSLLGTLIIVEWPSGSIWAIGMLVTISVDGRHRENRRCRNDSE